MWPTPDRVGRQELEIVMGDEHISFSTSKIGSLIEVNQSKYNIIYLKQDTLLTIFFIAEMLMDFEHSTTWYKI